MPVKLFYNEMSPPCRAVLMTARALAIELELEKVNIYTKEQIDQNLIRLNPEHTIPTMVDNDVVIWDSHEIVSYLVEKYGEDDNLYPKDSSRRALVDQKLTFDAETLFPRINAIISSIVIENEKEISTDKISAITEAYKLLDAFLEDKTYLAGDCLTIADFCCVATVSTATIIIPISTEKYPNLSTWYRNFKNFEYYEETNGEGLSQLDAIVEQKLGRPRNKELCD
ncbi:glutathione S-transferase 1-like [Coccinella septempunctata]|uniref:glutathione S-transferase 1-like n=1 Tax=Coccinella septempunctata TaxID=41139 RepID=UPI001D08E894|nr:glutathione S-transferase 1-like [Coccinella septempunctata]